MKHIKKLSLFFIILTFCVISTLSCSGKKESESEPYIYDGNFEVGMKIGDFETVGSLSVKEDFVSFLHSSENSSLFGMEEIFEEERYTVNFHEMSWNTKESFPDTYVIYHIFNSLKNKNIKKSENTMIGEKSVVQYFFSEKDIDFIFTMEKDTGNPVKIFGNQKDLSFEINFML